ncbi:BolA-like superfamily [Arabidopsis thaliana x Arabidopsis arenosa]|uniref:BolA-like superfamily n=1 Tax=Arabidopsis thaliana x Arabidopsis arenosa TaxID=1240361 RepID=A0A8T2C876_9BRAS|nr:BolA-like superfamily [Arabidopsis thaliana x Arabidopsis arenosa]
MFSSSIRLIVSGFHRTQTLKSPVNSPSVFISVPKFFNSESNSTGTGSRSVAMSSVEKTGSDSGAIENRASRMREKLQKELEPVELVIEDVSYQHAGHAGMKGRTDGETHFNVKIVSKGFEGMNLVKRHRDDDEHVWLKHYSSKHQILLVGEGDFSFSCSLATCFGSASNIYASSLDSYDYKPVNKGYSFMFDFLSCCISFMVIEADDVVRKYKKARSNLETLKRLGAFLLHGVDATKLLLHPDLHYRRFDRVIFNFPHTGFHGKESDPCQIHCCNFGNFLKDLLHVLCLHMVRADGEVHVSHKNKAPFCHWNLEELASRCFLVLIQRVAFEKRNYPGYENKRGDGSRCDQPFLLGECSTFKFKFSLVAKELYAEKVKWREVKEREPKCSQDFSTRAMNNKHARFEDSSIHLELPRCTERTKHHLSLEMHNGALQRAVTRTSFPREYTKESLEISRLLCQDFAGQDNQKPFPKRSLRFSGVSHGIHNGRVRKMLIRNSSGESRKRRMRRQRNIKIR